MLFAGRPFNALISGTARGRTGAGNTGEPAARFRCHLYRYRAPTPTPTVYRVVRECCAVEILYCMCSRTSSRSQKRAQELGAQPLIVAVRRRQGSPGAHLHVFPRPTLPPPSRRRPPRPPFWRCFTRPGRGALSCGQASSITHQSGRFCIMLGARGGAHTLPPMPPPPRPGRRQIRVDASRGSGCCGNSQSSLVRCGDEAKVVEGRLAPTVGACGVCSAASGGPDAARRSSPAVEPRSSGTWHGQR